MRAKPIWRCCDHENLLASNEALDHFEDWDAYPTSWPLKPGEKLPIGVVPLNSTIAASAEKRLSDIRYDLVHAGERYPRIAVQDAMQYWNVEL
jgi:hypothetical protein